MAKASRKYPPLTPPKGPFVRHPADMDFDRRVMAYIEEVEMNKESGEPRVRYFEFYTRVQLCMNEKRRLIASMDEKLAGGTQSLAEGAT